MLGTNLDTAWANRASKHMRDVLRRSDAPSSLIAPLRPLFSGAEIALVNVESAIGEGPSPSKCGPNSTNCFAFRAPLASARAIRSLAPRAKVVGNLANNHARDAGNAGQDSTVAALLRAGVLVSGDDTLPTLVPTPAGDTVAVLGFYTFLHRSPMRTARLGAPGLMYSRSGTRPTRVILRRCGGSSRARLTSIQSSSSRCTSAPKAGGRSTPPIPRKSSSASIVGIRWRSPRRRCAAVPRS